MCVLPKPSFTKSTSSLDGFRLQVRRPLPSDKTHSACLPGLVPSRQDLDMTARAAALAAEFGERLTLMAAQDRPGDLDTCDLEAFCRSCSQDVRKFKATDNRRCFEVVRKPMVAVRTMPHKDALIVPWIVQGGGLWLWLWTTRVQHSASGDDGRAWAVCRHFWRG